MKIAVLGFDREGRSSYDYFSALADGHELTILDQDRDRAVPDGADCVLGPDYLQDLDRFDLILRTPGLHPHKIFEANPELSPAKVSSQINEFFVRSPTRNIIGITGTKGKGTTSTLTHQMLLAAGKDAHIAGNIGIPALDLLQDLTAESWVVLELSSFQLCDLKSSPMIAACLMVAPEHLNWHADMAEYVNAKQQLFMWQTFDDVAVYNTDNEYSATIASAGNGAKVPYMSEPGAVVQDGAINIGGLYICLTSELQLLGAHNWQNACAAITIVWQITHQVSALRSVLTTFAGLPHRLELVRELDGVKYYDDSFGTTPETAIVAIEAFAGPKLIILGGSDKGASYDDLATAVLDGNVKQALLIGDQAERIGAALDKAGFSSYQPGGASMAEIVATAHGLAADGDVVLLSTGCASFGMFKDYKDRGDQFKATVTALPPAAG